MLATTIPIQKTVPGLFYEHGYSRGTERVVAVVYYPLKGKFIPFSVFTVLAEEPNPDWIYGLYDFDWCRRDQALYFHLSGSGGSFYLNQLAEPQKKPRSVVWWDRTLVAPTDDTIRSHKLSDGAQDGSANARPNLPWRRRRAGRGSPRIDYESALIVRKPNLSQLLQPDTLPLAELEAAREALLNPEQHAPAT